MFSSSEEALHREGIKYSSLSESFRKEAEKDRRKLELYDRLVDHLKGYSHFSWSQREECKAILDEAREIEEGK